MRAIGSRRGNAILRASVQMSARRRLESWIVPHAASAPGGAPEDAGPEYTRAFFDRVRNDLLPRMTPALALEGAEVRWLGAGGAGMWAMDASVGLVLALECADTPALLAERAKRWLACLRTRTTPGVLDRTWGQPVYGARLDAGRDEPDVVWSRPGEWRGVVLAGAWPAGGALPAPWRAPEPAGA